VKETIKSMQPRI